MAKRKLYFWPNDQVRKSCAEILCVANNIVPDKLKVLAMHHQQSVKRSCSVLIIENHTVIDIRVDPSDIHNVTVPRGVLHIGRGWGDRGPFENCINLTSVTLPNTLTTIETGAFYKCSGLTSLTLPDALTTVGAVAFWRCTALTSVVFQPPESRGALICWAVGNSHLVLRRLSGVLHHITTFALWSRDVSSVNADGTIFFGCDNLRLQ